MANIDKTENRSTETRATGQVIDTEKLKVFWVTEAEEALRVAQHLLE